MGSAMNGRRGAVINAMGALDIACMIFVEKPWESPVTSYWAGLAVNSSRPTLRYRPEGVRRSVSAKLVAGIF